MGPSFNKIPEIELPPVLMTWKICLLRFPKISGPFDEIFTNKVDFGPLVEVVETLKFVSNLQINFYPDDPS